MEPISPIRVLLVDDHAVVRSGLAAFLMAFDDLVFVGEAGKSLPVQIGAAGAGKMYVNDVGHRFLGADWPLFFTHLAEYPFETLICLLPWSGLLVVWCNRRFRRTQGQARPHALFLTVCLAVAIPTVWFPPDSRPRTQSCASCSSRSTFARAASGRPAR